MGRKCHICETNRWPGESGRLSGVEYSLLVGTHRNNKLESVSHKGTNYITGVNINGKSICLKCLHILLGLEDYYDSFFPNLIDNQEAIAIVKKIGSDERFVEVASKYLGKGNHLPDSVVEMVKESL